MPESSIEPSLVSRLLLDRDAEYRRANAAEQLVEELSDARVLKEKYERLISEKKRDIEEKRRIIEEKNEYILRLEQKLLYLERKMWGAMSEKHRVPDDPNQLRLDFEKTDMSEEEANTVRKALEEIDRYRGTRTAKAREKRIIRAENDFDSLGFQSLFRRFEISVIDDEISFFLGYKNISRRAVEPEKIHSLFFVRYKGDVIVFKIHITPHLFIYFNTFILFSQ